MKKTMILVAAVFTIGMAGCNKDTPVYLNQEPEPVSEAELVTESTVTNEADGTGSEIETATEENYVYVCGAVNAPGVYAVGADCRVFEVLNLAGGLTADACADAVNQAELVTDGQMLRIPTVEEAETEPGLIAQSGAAGETKDDKVNLNTASADELMTLPGIGQSKAESIIAYRQNNGGFKTIEDIKNITGIKDGVYTKIKDFIKV